MRSMGRIRISKINLGKLKPDKVIVGVYQPILFENMFEKDDRTVLYRLKDLDSFKNKIRGIVDLAINNKVNILCFPEMCMTQKLEAELIDFVKNKKIIIIGGSYYNNQRAVCPIITPRGSYYTEKVNPSIYECSAERGASLAKGDNILVIKSNFGNFAVLICSDFLNESVRNLIYDKKNELDILFVISCNNNSDKFHKQMSTDCENANPGRYICYCNSKIKFGDYEADGKTAIFGLMLSNYLEDLKISGLKPEDGITYKVCEIEDDDLIIAKFDLKNKKISVPKQANAVINIEIIRPNRTLLRIYDGEKLFEIPTKIIKDKLRNLKSQDLIYEWLRSYSREQANTPGNIISLDQVKKYVTCELDKLLKDTFSELFEKYKDKGLVKVHGWEKLYFPYENNTPIADDILQKQIVQGCKNLTNTFPDTSSILNVLSFAVFKRHNVGYILITGRNTDKSNMDIDKISKVKKEKKLYKYYGYSPSSETAINWAIHNKTLAKVVVHLNTKEIFMLSCELLQDSNFEHIVLKHPFVKYNTNKIIIYEKNKNVKKNNIKMCIPIVEKAIDVDVIDLARDVSTAFPSNIKRSENILVIGKKHAAWFVVCDYKLEKIKKKSEEFNQEIGRFIEDYRHLTNSEIICPECRNRITASMKGVKGRVACNECGEEILF